MDFNPQQQHNLLKQMGYDGPTDPKMMEAFLSSNPGAAARMGKFSRVVKKRAGMAAGGGGGGGGASHDTTDGAAGGAGGSGRIFILEFI